MLELALKGNKTYWYWVLVLIGVISAGAAAFIYQCKFKLGITGLSQDVSWGFYVAQLTFLVGVAASAVIGQVLNNIVFVLSSTYLNFGEICDIS